MLLGGGGGKSLWAVFKYEQVPLFYFHYGRILHGPKGCLVNLSRKVNMAEGERPWGIWLRAEESRKKTGGGFSRGMREGWASDLGGDSRRKEKMNISPTTVRPIWLAVAHSRTLGVLAL